MPVRLLTIWVLVYGGLSQAQELHKNSFSGKSTYFVKGEDNVKLDVKVHELSGDRSRSLPTSERIWASMAAGKNEQNFAYFYYPTPAAPLTEDVNAELWVHSNRSGVQLLARIVFPRIRNPKQLDEPLTRLVPLDSYKAPAGGWQKLILKRPADILRDLKQSLRVELKADPDLTDAFIDRLVLNLYTGPGEVEVFLDNLEIGPIKPGAAPPPGVDPGNTVVPKAVGRSVPVEFERGKLTVGGVPVFPRFIRYSGTPMQALREAGFNALAMGPETPVEVLEDAIENYRFWVVPQIPPMLEGNPDNPANPLTARDADSLAIALRKFQAGDGVLFWDLGPVRSEDYRRASRTVEAIRTADGRRPVGADVWDGFGRFAIPMQLVGTHRDPLLTSLELDRYGSWLAQRQILASGSKFTWTWIQTHIPDWQIRLLYDKSPTDGFRDPVGPQPEQIRLLTYLAIANGCKGLGFWSDRFLADSHQGRDRLLQLALLNQEIEMLEPLLLNTTGEIRWVHTSHPAVKVAILRTTGKGLLAIPIWLGTGAQYVPPQGAVQNLTFTVPLVPDGAEPWEISPVRVHSLQNRMRITADGTQITLPEFDLTAAVVFTSDHAPDGLLAAWQKHTRRISNHASGWACDLAEQQLKKVRETVQMLDRTAPPVQDAPMLLREADKRLMEAKRARTAHNDEAAYFEALRAMRPMRLLMREYWDRAIRSLDHPCSSPYAVSFYTLPQHWELARLLRECTMGENSLPGGTFEALRTGDSRGVPVTSLPGWTVQEVALDDVVMSARIVSSQEAKDAEPPKAPNVPDPYRPTSWAKRIEDPDPPKPNLNDAVLRLSVSPKPQLVKKGERKPLEPMALERVFLAVNSPPVRFQPGTWVRISGWVKLPASIRASADGAMFFDTATGEAYAIRINDPVKHKDVAIWKQFHTYRKVPANGEIRVRLALTGFGTAYFDNIRIEPFVGSEARTVGNVEVLPVRK